MNAKRTSDPHAQVSDDNKITLVKEITDNAKKYGSRLSDRLNMQRPSRVETPVGEAE